MLSNVQGFEWVVVFSIVVLVFAWGIWGMAIVLFPKKSARFFRKVFPKRK